MRLRIDSRLTPFALVLATIGCGSAPKGAPAPPVPASPPVAAAAAQPAAAPFGAAVIDEMIRAEWKKQGITPSARVDDHAWLRRAYVDIVGRIPRPEDVLAFDADVSPDKRERLVERLLASPQYADHWAAYWDDVLMGRQVRAQTVDRAGFIAWLHEQFAKNRPWKDTVYDLLAATGQNSTGGPRYRGMLVPVSSAMGSAMDAPETDGDTGKPVNPAVNWLLKFESPQDAAGTASRTFLGVQIQCAQCHDHKTEAWKQSDFQKLASCFTRTQVVQIDKGNTMGAVRRVEVRDAPKPVPRYGRDPEVKAIAEAKPTSLDGKDLSGSPSARRALAEWITSKDNPWFAQAIVNRMWAHFVGRGFVDPVDDLRPSNAPEMGEVLKKLADDFVAHGYDMKHLVRTIAKTEVYNLASTGGAAAKGEDAHKLWSRFRVTPMGPEELLDSLILATDLEQTLKAQKVDLDRIRTQLSRQYGFLFDVDEEMDKPSFEGTMTQALALLNGSLTGAGSSALPGSALADVLKSKSSDAERIEALYLRTLSRKPTAKELEMWTKYVQEPGAPVVPTPQKAGPADALRRVEARKECAKLDARTLAYEDMFWALLNSSEFVFNH